MVSKIRNIRHENSIATPERRCYNKTDPFKFLYLFFSLRHLLLTTVKLMDATIPSYIPCSHHTQVLYIMVEGRRER